MMDDKKVRPLAVGSKVSQIATIFQNTTSSPAPDLILSGKSGPTSPKADRKAVDLLLKEPSSQVSVVRTQSHISRFHNARALFEKLGNEESRSIKPGEKVKSLSDLRSRSSSANSSLGEENSQRGGGKRSPSRSPSPASSGRHFTPQRSNGFTSSGDGREDKQNGFHHHPSSHLHSSSAPTQKSSSVPSLISPSAIKHFQHDQARAKLANGGEATATQNGSASPFTRDSSPFRPEKPERKFNSRELIEKQKNWTSHFSKTKTPATPPSGVSPRYNSDPSHFTSIPSAKTTSLAASSPPPAIAQKPNLPIAPTKSFLNKVVSPSSLPVKPTSSVSSPISIPHTATGETLADNALFRRNTSVSPPPVSERLSGSHKPSWASDHSTSSKPLEAPSTVLSNNVESTSTSSVSSPAESPRLAASSVPESGLPDLPLSPSISKSSILPSSPPPSEVPTTDQEFPPSIISTNESSSCSVSTNKTACSVPSEETAVRRVANCQNEDCHPNEDVIKSPEQITPDDSPNKSIVSSSPGRLSDLDYNDSELTFSERTQTLKRKKTHHTNPQVPYNLPPDVSPASQKYKSFTESSECDSGVFHFESSSPPLTHERVSSSDDGLSSLEGSQHTPSSLQFNLCDNASSRVSSEHLSAMPPHASGRGTVEPPPVPPHSSCSLSEEDSGFQSAEVSTVTATPARPELSRGLLDVGGDVQFADDESAASNSTSSEEREGSTLEAVPTPSDEQLISNSLPCSKVPDLINISHKPDVTPTSEPLMTPDEADNMLSSRIVAKRINRPPHESALLSDEEAKEVVRLLSPVPPSPPKDSHLPPKDQIFLPKDHHIHSYEEYSPPNDDQHILSYEKYSPPNDQHIPSYENYTPPKDCHSRCKDDHASACPDERLGSPFLESDPKDEEEEEQESGCWVTMSPGVPALASPLTSSPQSADTPSPRIDKLSSDEAFASLGSAPSNNTLDSYSGRMVGSTATLDSFSGQSTTLGDSYAGGLGSTNTLEDSKYDSSTLGDSHYGSVSGSESGIISSVGSLDELDRVSSSRDSVTLQNETEEEDENTFTEFVPEPRVEIFEEGGIHYYEDGNFWLEVAGLPDRALELADNAEGENIPVKANTKVKFSMEPIKVYSTFSMNEYDRRNEDVDPVAASAEYELEKRVEKLTLLGVELMKGSEGLGLSIIGMGVGADAGLEKLGIFVKTITEAGAAARDGRIQVNDQIIEVDGKSLVGVTQEYAASVLRNTSGLVRFLIGREKDPVNSEVAQLIRQSLQADREREEQRRRMDNYNANSTAADASRTSLNSSVNESLNSSMHSNADSLKQLLRESEAKMEKAQYDVKSLQARLEELEQSGAGKEEYAEKLRQSGLKLREVERSLFAARKEAASYQEMLQQSQGQYTLLEKKYTKAKRLIREFHQREADLLHREEFYQQLLQEKDVEYNSLVKALKDRVIQIEQELVETQKRAGLPVRLPFDPTSLKLVTPPSSSVLSSRPAAPPVRPLLESLGAELSDADESFEESLLQHHLDESHKSSTVERKMPAPGASEELDSAVPQHELLDSSLSRGKADLAARGRHLPSSVTKKTSGSISNSSSGYSLNDSFDTSDDADEEEAVSLDSSDVSSTQPGAWPIPTGAGLGVPGVPAGLSSSLDSDRKIYVEYLEQQNQQQNQHGSLQSVLPSNVADPWVYQKSARPSSVSASLAEQLKQVLAERERRYSGGATGPPGEAPPAAVSGVDLAEEVKAAVNEANAKVKRAAVSWVATPLGSSHGLAASSPESLSSVDSGDVWSPPNPQDTSPYLSSKKETSYHWQNVPVPEWSKEQVCQWLMALGLETYIGKFHEAHINGMSLLQLESRDFKALGVQGEDKNRLKRKLKDLKVQVEKEKRFVEKEKKEKEKLMKKAEKLAEKASKRK